MINIMKAPPIPRHQHHDGAPHPPLERTQQQPAVWEGQRVELSNQSRCAGDEHEQQLEIKPTVVAGQL